MITISGDQFPIGCDFFIDGQPIDFADGHTAELVIYIGAQKIIYDPTLYENNTAVWILTPDQTRELKQKKYDGKLTFSIRFYNLGNEDERETPIYKEPLEVKED